MTHRADFLKALAQRARMQPAPEWTEDSFTIKVTGAELQWLDEIAYYVESLEK